MIAFLRVLRPTAAVVLFFVSWQFLMVSEFVAWAKEPLRPQPTERQASAAEKFGRKTVELEGLLEKVRKDVDSGQDVSEQYKRIAVVSDELETLNTGIEDEFAATGNKLDEISAAPVIHERQRKALAGYREKFKEMKRLLSSTKQHRSGTGDLKKDVDDLETFLKGNKAKSRQISLDPNNLSHRAAKTKKIVPKETREEYEKDERFKPAKPQHGWNQVLPKDGVMIASASGDLMGFFRVAQAAPSGGIPAPTPEDLAPTIDVQLTDAIRAKAAELGNQPLPIYQWVRNNVEFVPTYGSIQGADFCLQTKQCNAFDTASLLVALLRVSGISARYLYGTIEIPADKAMNWVGGVTKPELAVQILNMGGVPAVAVVEGSQITKVRLEHVWVEGWIDYVPSRGAVHRQGDNWIPMDSSWKQYSYTDGIDLAAAVPFDAQGFADHLKATTTVNEAEGWATGVDSTYIAQQLSAYQTQVSGYLSQNLPNATPSDLLGKKGIVAEKLPTLASVLPYKRIALAGRYPALPDSWRGKITISLPALFGEEGPTYQAALPSVAGKRVTLSYAPATAADQLLIESLLPKAHADGTQIQLAEFPSDYPAYLIQLKPELRIDGSVVATGSPAMMGSPETMSVSFDIPGLGRDLIEKRVAAGEYFGVGVETGRVGTTTLDGLKARLESTKARIENQNFSGLTKEELLGDLLSITIATYFGELDAQGTIAARRMGVVQYRTPSLGFSYVAADVEDLFGMPWRVGSRSLMMDIVKITQVALSKDGSTDKTVTFMRSSGMMSSVLEHSVPERLFSQPSQPVSAISAMKALQMANDQGIPIYRITQANVATVLPQLTVADDVKTTISDAVGAGKEITVSKGDITFGGWSGCGYIVVDPATGAAAYLISGGINGGVTLMRGISLLFFALALLGVWYALPLLILMPALIAPVIFFVLNGLVALYVEIALIVDIEKTNDFFLCLGILVGEHVGMEYGLGLLSPGYVAELCLIIAMNISIYSFGKCLNKL